MGLVGRVEPFPALTGEPLVDTERRAGRARELQDEIRRRSGESQRPRTDRDYLGRLLERF